ncbi:MAG: homoserine dehydrogenase, partial [Planctomycetota bacterium]|nr:homoserine dehydrogenase [Planctomycetota bacterium]
MSENVLRVGIAGAGTVGAGVIEILMTRAALLEQRSGVRLALTRVADIDTAKAQAAGAPKEIIAADGLAVATAPDIDIFVEVIGGTGAAEKMVRAALQAGKPVVTANKALLAEKGRPLFALAREKGVPLAFEAAVCGGIPIILALREGLIVNRILSLLGIVNGTCNFILTRMAEKIPYAAALAEAQRQGYAEADPRLDVEGIDSGHKLALLSALAFDTWPDFNFLPIEGISRLDVMDVEFANYLEYTVKLLAVGRTDPSSRRLFLSVHPALLRREHPLAGVHGSMNAVVLEADVAREAMFYGR